MTTIQAIDLLKGLEQSLDDYCELNDEGKTAFRMGITALELFGNSEQLPSAQPEIIYCKKCKHWTRTCGDEQWSLGDCDVFDKHLVMCNGYCAWAERREE